MRWNMINIIMKKEIREAMMSKYVLWSIIGIPILMGIILPLLQLAPFVGMSDEDFKDEADLGIVLTDNWSELSEFAKFIIFMIEMSNIMLLLIPMIMPTVIAADTFSGEKDRKTAEALVAAPVTDSEIYVGKVLSTMLPTLISLYVVGIIYVVIVNSLTSNILGFNYLPNTVFLVNALLLGPLMGLATVNFMIFVSTKTTSTRDAQQMGSLIALPLMGIMVSIGFSAYISPLIMWAAVFGMVIFDIILTKIGIGIMDREKWVR